MSTASEGLPSRKEAIYLWVAHRRLWFTGLMMTIMIISAAYGSWLPYGLTTIAVLLWTTAGAVAFRHGEGPQGNNCIECMYHRPDDGARRAQKHMRILRFEHHILSSVVLFVLLVVFAIISHQSVSVGLLVYGIGFVLHDVAEHIHHRLRPWCPWCQPRGGGDTHVCASTPDPSMTKVS